MKKLLTCALLFLCVCCAKKEPGKDAEDPIANDKVADLDRLYIDRLAEAFDMRDPDTGFLDLDDCDGFLWNVGKYAAALKVVGVKVTATEFADQPGKFDRRPAPCWTPEGGDKGAKTTWSGDMGKGLLAYAWSKKDLGLLSRHISYGEAHSAVVEGFPRWQMGDPHQDVRVWYSPAQVGLAYRIRLALGGPSNVWKMIRNTYPKGLTDYQAHLQVWDIVLNGQVATELGDVDGIPHSGDEDQITGKMFNRLQEQAAREPRNPFFAYALGVYTGNLDTAVDLCLDLDMPHGEYVRCKHPDACILADWLYTCGEVLKRFGRHD